MERLGWVTLRQLKNLKGLTRDSKTRVWNALVEPVVLYNSELWTLTKTLEKEVDVLQRKMLRRLFNLTWKDKVSNTKLYELAKTTEWSQTIRRRRLRLMGHLLRHPETPAYKTLTTVRMPRTRQKNYLTLVSGELRELGLDLTNTNTWGAALDRGSWRNLVRGSDVGTPTILRR